MGAMAASEAAAGREPGGPQGPGVGAEWLILQRLSDIKEQLGDLRRGLDEVRHGQEDLRAGLLAVDARISAESATLDARISAESATLDARISAASATLDARIGAESAMLRRELDVKIDGLRTWSLGLLLLAILGLLAKLLIPGA